MANSEQLKSTLSEVLFEKEKINKALLTNVVKNLDVLPSNQALNFFDASAYKGKFGTKPTDYLVNLIKKNGKDYDYVIIDTAPFMNLLSLASFKAADKIVIPTQTEIFSIKGIVDLVNHIKESKTKAEIMVVPTMFVFNSNLHRDALVQLKAITKKNKISLTKTIISKSVAASNAFAYDRKPLVLTGSRSKQAKQLLELVKEVK